MELGTAKLPITPQNPVRLCGYATRTGCFEDVREDIFLRVQLHRYEDISLLFVYADLLWWGSDFVKDARENLGRICGIPEEHIFFVASHNHSGPPTGSRFTPTLETYNPDYARFLHEQVTKGVRQALRDAEAVTVFRHDGSSAFNVFRRVVRDGTVAMEPNYQVSADHAHTILAFRRPDNSLKAAMVHYPCHANLSDGNAVHPDYPGIALRMLDNAYPGSISIFLQGCTGDLRPNSVLGRRFTSVSYEKAVTFAGDFCNACKELLKQKPVQIIPGFSVKRQCLDLPLENLLGKAELEDCLQAEEGVRREWARVVLDKSNRSTERLELSRITYGDHLRFYTMNAEASQYYAAFARDLDPDAVCVAYTNGMIGYMCTASQITEGGYEPDGSALYFGLAGTYKQEIETMIHEAMKVASKE